MSSPSLPDADDFMRSWWAEFDILPGDGTRGPTEPFSQDNLMAIKESSSSSGDSHGAQTSAAHR